MDCLASAAARRRDRGLAPSARFDEGVAKRPELDDEVSTPFVVVVVVVVA